MWEVEDNIVVCVEIDKKFSKFFKTMSESEISTFINKLIELNSNNDLYTNLLSQLSHLETEMKINFQSLNDKLDNTVKLKQTPSAEYKAFEVHDNIDIELDMKDSIQDIEIEDVLELMEGELY